MSLDDTILNIEREEQSRIQKIRKQILWARFFKKIESYSIPREKVELLREFGKYINDYNFNSEVGKNFEGSNYTMTQIKTPNNESMAVMIERNKAIYRNYKREEELKVTQGLASTIGDYVRLFLDGFHTSTSPKPMISSATEEEYIDSEITQKGGIYRELTDKPITPEEYQKRLNQFELIGSQDFYALNLGHFRDRVYSETFLYGFYTKDGNLFMNEDCAHDIAYGRSGDIEEYLVQEAYKLKHKKYPN